MGAETNTQGWLPVPVIEYCREERWGCRLFAAFEVVSFYTMYNMAPVGRYHVQVCGTTPCMLRGSDDVLAGVQAARARQGATTPDGLFTLTEVECLGACANAPMVQINDDNYEDLTFDSMSAILETLASGGTPKPGPQIDRQTSAPRAGRRRCARWPTRITIIAGVGMTVEETRFFTDMLRGIRADMSDVRIRLTGMELRQTAMEQRLAGMDTHLLALQHGIDHLSSDMRRVKQRLELVDEGA